MILRCCNVAIAGSLGSPRELKLSAHGPRYIGDSIAGSLGSPRELKQHRCKAFTSCECYRGLPREPARVETPCARGTESRRRIIAGSLGSPRELKHRGV